MAKRSAAAGRWALLAALVVLAACADATLPEEGIVDFAEIAAQGPMIETDPSGTSVTLRVTTTIDAVCAVSFGETAALGRLATDRDMGAAGHSDHEVLLSGLEPDTEYFYRLQGVAEDGRLYRSELFSFGTEPSSGAVPGRNVAVSSTVVEFSSEFSSAFAAANAIDADPATEWSTRGDGDDAYLVVDLGRQVDVTAVGFHTRAMSDGSATTETFTITVDNATTYGPFPVGRVAVSFNGRLVRFDVDQSSGGNTGAIDVEVFETG